MIIKQSVRQLIILNKIHMKFAVALAAIAAFGAATPMGEFEHEFIRFLATHNRRYATKEEYNMRLAEFSKNHSFVKEFSKKGTKQTVKVNAMGDWTRQEYRQLLGYKSEMVNPSENKVYENDTTTTSHIDWRSEGAVTPVKNQGQCGSCWTFSSTGSLEGRHFQKSGVLTSFSEQQLVDCCTGGVGSCYGSQGCQGGIMDEALTYSQTYDLMTEADYPYTAQNGACSYKGAGTGAGYTNASKSDIQPKSKSAFKASIATGPTSIAIEADQMAFQFYNGGVLDSGCGEQLDHGVLAVGFGTDAATKEQFAIVKNSWGATWGDAGFLKISLDNDSCGLMNSPVRPN
jgi:C1A family cysteine protease